MAAKSMKAALICQRRLHAIVTRVINLCREQRAIGSSQFSIRDKRQYGTKQCRYYEFNIETAASFPLTHFRFAAAQISGKDERVS